jgi:serine protease Do
MKHIYFLISTIFFFSTTLFAQVKNYIPIVKPVLYEKTKETFENVANKFEQKNHPELANIFRSYAQGGHGSGFVYLDSDGENYIITNRHVVANSQFVNLEFPGKGSTKTVYESCPIIYTDDNIDLAVVKFPNDEKVFDKSFKLISNRQPDGREIWSAGYPGLMGKPMWQFAKGNVTNEEAYVEQLVATDISYLVQHSASIDPGNSGGPLLVKENNEDENYSVVGINTWTITNRQNTFFAIPAKNIPLLIKNAKEKIALKSQKDELRLSLITSAKVFAAEMNSEKPNWDKMINFISYGYVGTDGWDSFIRLLNEGDMETLKSLETKFFSYSPIEAMRFSILYRMWKKVQSQKDKSPLEYNHLNSSDEAAGKDVRANFKLDKQLLEFYWTFEHGHWRIGSFDLDKISVGKDKSYSYEDDSKATKRERSVYFGIDVFGSPYSRSLNSVLAENFNMLGAGGTLSINFGGRSALFVRGSSLSFNNEMKNRPESLTAASVKYFYINTGTMIYIGSGKLRPYIILGFNYLKFSETASNQNTSMTKNFERFGPGLGFGLKYKITNRLGIFTDGVFNADNIMIFEVLDDTGNTDLSNVNASVGLSFDLKKNNK